jgi:hypothetical protein
MHLFCSTSTLRTGRLTSRCLFDDIRDEGRMDSNLYTRISPLLRRHAGTLFPYCFLTKLTSQGRPSTRLPVPSLSENLPSMW